MWNNENQQSGFSLLSTLIFLGIISVSIPIILNNIANSNKVSKKRRDIDIYYSFVGTLKEHLRDPYSCTQLLRNTVIDRDTSEKTDISLDYNFGDIPSPLEAGSRSEKNNFEIERVYIQTSRDNSLFITPTNPTGIFRSVRLWGSPDESETVPIRVFFQPKDLMVALSEDTSKTPIPPESLSPVFAKELQITLYANVDASNAIQTCYGQATEADACEYLDKVFDPNETTLSQNCKPDKYCMTKNTVGPADNSTGNGQGVTSSTTSCLAPYDDYIQKVGRNLDGSFRYMCSWCHNPR